MYRLKIIGALLAIVAMYFFVFAGIAVAVSQVRTQKQESTVDITIHNSYRFEVQLEVKCDWSHKEQRFLYHEKLRAPGWQNTVIKVPNHHKKCDVWPHVKLY